MLSEIAVITQERGSEPNSRTEQLVGLCTELNRYGQAHGPNWRIDPESEDLFTGGFNVWVRDSRNDIDYLCDRLASAKGVRTEYL